jgi:MFS superfamily sulfate permease-like transporter
MHFRTHVKEEKRGISGQGEYNDGMVEHDGHVGMILDKLDGLGFLTGVAANILLGQISDLTGAEAEGAVALTRALDVVLHPSRIQLASLLVGGLTLALMVVLTRTRLASYASVIALVVPSLLALALPTVATVSDVGYIPTGKRRRLIEHLARRICRDLGVPPVP